MTLRALCTLHELRILPRGRTWYLIDQKRSVITRLMYVPQVFVESLRALIAKGIVHRCTLFEIYPLVAPNCHCGRVVDLLVR